MWDNYSSILEGLSYSRFKQSEKFYGDLDEAVDFETVFADFDDLEEVDEANMVTFNKKAYPRDGWAVVLAGGSGSGKGVVVKRKLMIDAKVIDVDRLKELYAALDKKKTGKNWDFGNPEHVRELHKIIKEKGWKDTIINTFFNDNGSRLTNIIFDVTGKSVSSLKEYIIMAKKVGYKVSFVWVVTNRGLAMIRNLSRTRVVDQDLFHDIHNRVKATVFPFLRSSYASFVDEAWIVFSGKAEHSTEPYSPYAGFERGEVVKLKKVGGKFVSPPERPNLEREVVNHLGPDEVNPFTPEVYLDFADVKGQLAGVARDDKGRISAKAPIKVMRS